MRLLSSHNLFKSGQIMVDPEKIRVIDSNEAASKKLATVIHAFEQTQEAALYCPPGFDDEAGVDDGMDALFGDAPGAGMTEPEEEGAQFEESGGAGSKEAAKVLEQARAKAQEITERANEQAQQILEEAHARGEQEAKEAYESAKAQAMQDGCQEAEMQLSQERERLHAEYEQKERKLKETYEQKLEEMEPVLVQKLTGIYEHIFAVDLSQYKRVLAHLIGNTLRSVPVSDSYLIHVSEQDFSYVSMQKAQLMEEGCTGSARIEIIEDRTLSKNECLVETEDGIFDCSLSVQLTELKRKLQLLSYTGKKE